VAVQKVVFHVLMERNCSFISCQFPWYVTVVFLLSVSVCIFLSTLGVSMSYCTWNCTAWDHSS